ncbi:O-acetyl-ADP-ribose deacetylase [Thermoplasma sp.]|uniref:O-acetyl-ADP-ribose deacetylase n=1 Tax=Thermoplasma sp. TaxID=1973142 RepID=UPI00127CAEF6|nr:O-acetyl-ADP-ribose deacetylase [Thermoplasma sp.]KAA8922952.1 MAG: O-acetyl-ADP-ribose deacetylase [Thermoplasma sp.]
MKDLLNFSYGKHRIIVEVGDITESDADAIVNAANSSLMGGGGVDGAIHSAAGPELDAELAEIRRRRYPGGLPPGEAVITRGYRLKSAHVIHTVGPVWMGGHGGEDEVLYRAYKNSMMVAADNGIRDIAFPAISTGAYGFPFDHAERIAIRSVRDFLNGQNDAYTIRFIFYTESQGREFLSILAKNGMMQ